MISVAIYWLAIRLYDAAIRLAAPFNAKAALFVNGRKRLLKKIRYALIDEKRPRIWIHCASLGEFEQGRPVLEALRREYSNYAIVLTFFSPSGYEVRKDYNGADHVFYLPLDSYHNAKGFIELVQPKIALFVKYDLWYFFLTRIAKRNIPLILVSAIFRKEQAFFQWYGKLYRRMLEAFTHIFVQDENSIQLLNKIGVEHTTTAGDTRFDRVIDVAQNTSNITEIDRFCKGRRVLVAGSTWPDDEKLLKEAFFSNLRSSQDWRLIIAPHEVNEAHIKELQALFDNDCLLWSEYQTDTEKPVLIIDTIGILSTLYKHCTIAYIGGGFNRSGIHNVLEAVVYGKKVVHGPEYKKFKEAKELVALGVSTAVDNTPDMLKVIETVAQGNVDFESISGVAKQYVLKNAGATDAIIGYISEKKLLTVS